MPTSSTRTATPGPSTFTRGTKRQMSDAEPPSNDPKKQRVDVASPHDQPRSRRDSNRDARRRKKKKKKAPIVAAAGAGVVLKNESAADQPPASQRAPLSAHNDIIRFNSAVPDPVPSSNSSSGPFETPMQGPSAVPVKNARSGSQQPVDLSASESSPSSPKNKCKAAPTPHSTSLEDKVAQLTQELAAKNELIASHQTLSNQIQQAVTCQICLDLMYKPYALAPCGHLACYNCLVQWFTAPPQNNGPAPPAIMRKKTCPHCRAVVRERPIEVWAVKGIAQSIGKSGLVSTPVPPPADLSESANAITDPWNNIFPKAGSGHRRFPWFFPGVDEEELPMRDLAARGEDVGMLDMEDGGIYRCLDCMHEIWDGTCSSCGRVYPGHGHDEDENEEDEAGWIEDQMGAEEVDMGDDPGWMGLEGGDGDDDGMDDDGIGPFGGFGAPWEYRMQMLEGPFGFLGAIHIEEEEEEDDSDGGTSDGGGGSEDEDGGYESSFIDDEEDVGMARIYEIADGGRSSDIEDEVSSVRGPSTGMRTRAGAVVSSDEEDSASDAPRGGDDDSEEEEFVSDEA